MFGLLVIAIVPGGLLEAERAHALAPIAVVGLVVVSYTGSVLVYQLLSGFMTLTASGNLGPNVCGIFPDGCGVPKIKTAPKAILVESGEKKILEEIQKKMRDNARDKAIELIKKLLGGWDCVTVGADAGPKAPTWKFTYRSYCGFKSAVVSRWDFYPPGSWTINTWFADLNKDGRADLTLPPSVTAFGVAW